MRYRERVLEQARADAVALIWDMDSSPDVLDLAQQLYTALRFDEVLEARAKGKAPPARYTKSPSIINFVPDQFLSLLIHLATTDIYRVLPPDPFLVAAVEAFIFAPPSDQAKAYFFLCDLPNTCWHIHSPRARQDLENDMFEIARSDRKWLHRFWAKSRREALATAPSL